MRMSTPKRKNIQRDQESTITNATSGLRVPSISTCPKCPQSTWACSPGRVASLKKASAALRGR